MTQAEFIALARRVSFGGGLLFWAVELSIVPMVNGGASVRIIKKVLDSRCNKLDINNPMASAPFMGAIAFDEAFRETQLLGMDETEASERLLSIVRDSMIHEIDESIRWDGKIAHDPHAEDGDA